MIQDSILVCSPDIRIPHTAQLDIALQQCGCQTILDIMALTRWEIESLQWVDGSKPKDKMAHVQM
jgi:hypothetical protein